MDGGGTPSTGHSMNTVRFSMAVMDFSRVSVILGGTGGGKENMRDYNYCF